MWHTYTHTLVYEKQTVQTHVHSASPVYTINIKGGLAGVERARERDRERARNEWKWGESERGGEGFKKNKKMTSSKLWASTIMAFLLRVPTPRFRVPGDVPVHVSLPFSSPRTDLYFLRSWFSEARGGGIERVRERERNWFGLRLGERGVTGEVKQIQATDTAVQRGGKAISGQAETGRAPEKPRRPNVHNVCFCLMSDCGFVTSRFLG